MNLSESSGLESSATVPIRHRDWASEDHDLGRLKQRDHTVPSPQPQLSSCNFTRLAQFRCHHFPRADAPVPTFFDQRQSKNRRNSLWTQRIGKRILCLMTLSARNRLEGKVTEIQFGGVMAHVVVRVGKSLVESVITKRSVEEMKLKVGDKVTAVIKSTEVMLDKS